MVNNHRYIVVSGWGDGSWGLIGLFYLYSIIIDPICAKICLDTALYPPALYTQYHHEMELLAQLNRSITPNTDTSHSPMAMDWFDVLSLGGGVPKLSVDGQYVEQRIWQK